MEVRMSTLITSLKRADAMVSEICERKWVQKRTLDNFATIESVCQNILNNINRVRMSQNDAEPISETLSSTKCTNSDTTAIYNNDYSVTKRIVSEFAATLESLANKDHGNYHVNDCFAMIWKWYQLRILKAKSYTKFDRHFCYKVSDMRTWIYAIVIYYGWCIENDQVSTFNAKFDSFFDKLGKDEKITCYSPLPYEVYQIARGNAPEYANLTSIYLWENMIDSGLRVLTDTKRYPKASICTSTVMSLVDKWKPGIINDYDDYLLHPLI